MTEVNASAIVGMSTTVFYPYEKGAGGGGLAMPKGGGRKKFWGSFYTEVLAILKGGAKGFHSLKGRGRKMFHPVLRGGGAQKVSDPRFSHFVPPPPPH